MPSTQINQSHTSNEVIVEKNTLSMFLPLQGKITPPQRITVNYSTNARGVLIQLLESAISDDRLVMLGGGIEGSELSVNDFGPDIGLRFEHCFIKTQVRLLKRDDGIKFIINDGFEVYPDAPDGIATTSIVYQVFVARELGFQFITTFAAGSFQDEEFNGYYTWVRLGFNALLTDQERAMLPAFLNESLTTNQVMLRDGQEWWKKNGSERKMWFDLDSDSDSFKVLRKYLKEKGYKIEV